MTQQTTERARKKFWVADSDSIAVSEEECLGSHDPSMWFCPKYGFTGTLGSAFFENRQAAVRSLQEITLRKLRNAEEAHRKAMAL